jgi:hypothetical protein
MERKTHILFTITGIYWIATLLKIYQINNEWALFYILLVASFPIISIPYQAIVTTLPDSDLHNSRLHKTVLAPALWILSFFVNHRWATHRIEGIIIFSLLMLLLYILWTSIITLTAISFLAITIVWVLIDNFRVKILWIRIKKIWIWRFSWEIDTKFIHRGFSTIIFLFFPILLIPEVYQYFLISMVFAYIFHMFWDAFSKEGWTVAKIPFTKKKLKFQMPYYLAFRVGGRFERIIIRTLLWAFLIFIILIDYRFWMDKITKDFLLTYQQFWIIYNNPELLISDLDNIKQRVDIMLEFIRKILSLI